MRTDSHGNHKPCPLQIAQPHRLARLVFAISLNDAQKVINVRSPLVLHNLTELPLEVRLQASTVAHGNSKYAVRKGTESEWSGVEWIGRSLLIRMS